MPAVVAGRLWVSLAAVMWSSSGLFAKARHVRRSGRWSRAASCWRSGGRCSPACSCCPRAAAAAGTASWCRFARVHRHERDLPVGHDALTTAANAIWLQSTAPWWVFLVGVLILGEPFAAQRTLSAGDRRHRPGGHPGVSKLQGQDQAGVSVRSGLGLYLCGRGAVAARAAAHGYRCGWWSCATWSPPRPCFPTSSRSTSGRAATQLPVLAGFGLLSDGAALCVLRPRDCAPSPRKKPPASACWSRSCCRCGSTWSGTRRRRCRRW